jgi:transposase
LPLKKGRAGTMTHDYKRNGTTTLFAALDVATGKVIGECLPRHRAKEFLKFLRRIDKETLPCLDLHLILDNYATHKTPTVQRWLKRHPRFKLHFTPTSSSWLNLVERLFAEITRQRIRRGVFRSVPELGDAITEWINHRNAPKTLRLDRDGQVYHSQTPPQKGSRQSRRRMQMNESEHASGLSPSRRKSGTASQLERTTYASEEHGQ